MKKQWLSVMAAGLLLVTGCGQGEEAERGSVEQMTYGMLGPGPANYGMMRSQTKYNHPSEINNSTSWRTLHGERRDLGDDEQLIHHIIHDKHHLEMGMVILVGKDAYVNVTFPKELDDKEKEEKLGELKRDLMTEVPRYTVHVREKEAR